VAHVGSPGRESGAHCWQAGWLLAAWLTTGAPGVERTWSEEGILPSQPKQVAKIRNYQYIKVQRSQGENLRSYQGYRGTKLPLRPRSLVAPGGPADIYIYIYIYIYRSEGLSSRDMLSLHVLRMGLRFSAQILLPLPPSPSPFG
jgi:hypothetical protein